MSVDGIKFYNVVLTIIVSKNLGSNSWETISIISQQGKAEQYWSVGDYKLGLSYEEYELPVNTDFYIADFNHDAPNSITFAVMHLGSRYSHSKWDENSKSKSEYLKSSLYSTLTNDILPILPCKDYIREVTKQIIKNEEASLKIFSFSAIEVFGSFGDNETEGSVYSYFKAGNRSASSNYVNKSQQQVINIEPCWGRTWSSRYGAPFSFSKNSANYDTSPTESLINGFGFVI